MDNNRYFFLSGFISISFFLILLCAFIFLLFKDNKIKTYGLKKEKFISVSIKDIPIQKPKKSKNIQSNKKQLKEVKKTKPKKEKIRKQVDAVDEDLDVGDLFDNVWTKKIDTKAKTKKRKKTDIKRLAEIQKSIEIDKTSSKDLRLTQPNQQSKKEQKLKSSSADEVNKYLAKIHSIVYDNFFPPANSEGNFVKAVIELSALGKVIDFRILNYSQNSALNEEVDKIKFRIKNIIFPKNPQNQNRKIVIILRAEDKE